MIIESYKGYRIVISHDEDMESPRSWSNMGTMVCLHNKYLLGDTPQDIAKGDFNSWDEVRDEIVRRGGVLILPLGLYDHGGISMYVGSSHDRWDGGQVGFIYVTQDDLDREGVSIEKAEDILKHEVEVYDKYLRGEFVQYRVEKDNTCPTCKHTEPDFIDSCSGYGSTDEALSEARSIIDSYEVSA